MPSTPRYIYHLSDGNTLALDLGQRLQAEGFDVEPVATVAELSEFMLGLSPHLVLVDASHLSELADVGTARTEAQQRVRGGTHRIRLVAMGAHDNLHERLQARRAGVDALLLPPFDVAEIVKQLQALLAPAAENKLRVLIVEDDRAQALFAQSVLTNAGMQAQAEHDPMRVLEAMEALQPDLVLMDLHMPDANGVELTALIREHPSFRRTPIVFLSGESDPDARFDAIDAGGDDFLAKPIRPKHLIAAVQNRVRRVRELEKPTAAQDPRDVATGLYRRDFLLDRINEALAATSSDPGGGALFVEIEGTAALRERFGLSVLEHVLLSAARVLADALGERPWAAGIHDHAFLILAAGLDDAALDALGRHVRDRLMQHDFEAGNTTVRLRASVGVCALRSGFDDANALLDTAERACREARNTDAGIKRYVSPQAAERHRQAAQVDRLRDAIGKDVLELIYQPIVAVQGGGEAQFQTLLRMRDANGRLLPAADILPVAERGGLMIDIDRWVLTHALRVIRKQSDIWRPVRLFVPQAVTTTSAKDQPDWLKGELAAKGVSGASLVIESRLEDALLNPPALVAFEHALRANGVRSCLGQYEHTAEANRLLEELRPAFIKLAWKYAAPNAPQEVRNELREAIDRAHALGVLVIGHRVEDARSAATLWMSGIDFVQGNLVQGAGDALDFDFSAAVL